MTGNGTIGVGKRFMRNRSQHRITEDWLLKNKAVFEGQAATAVLKLAIAQGIPAQSPSQIRESARVVGVRLTERAPQGTGKKAMFRQAVNAANQRIVGVAAVLKTIIKALETDGIITMPAAESYILAIDAALAVGEIHAGKAESVNP